MRKKIRILVIDDSKDILEIIKMNLEPEGYDVITASSGKEGLRLAFQKRPDLILLDILMPDINGFEVCRRLKDTNSTKYTPIIMISVKRSSEDVKSAVSAGACDYIAKPFISECILEKVKNVLNGLAFAEISLREFEHIIKSSFIPIEEYEIDTTEPLTHFETISAAGARPERRLFFRLKVIYPMKIKIDETIIPAMIRDISASGMYLITKKLAVSKGEDIFLISPLFKNICFTDRIEAIVVRVSEISSESARYKWQLAVKYKNFKEDDIKRFLQFLFREEVTRARPRAKNV
ncbi:MAG: response regulator [Candidatus Hydrogenedentota bacterium]